MHFIRNWSRYYHFLFSNNIIGTPCRIFFTNDNHFIIVYKKRREGVEYYNNIYIFYINNILYF